MFALIDCNNFFVSCERVFQPALKNVPTIVLSSNDGCVIARSQEVKSIGIPMGIPLFKIKEIIKQHNIQLRSTNFKLYRDMSRRVMEVIHSIASSIEVYSIDEAFIQVPQHISPFLFCKKIRDEVLLQTGIPVSIGVAPTKTLAKLANKKAKEKQTSHIFIFNLKNKNKIAQIFKSISVGEIWGIGREFSDRLVSKNILNIYQLIHLPDSTIRTFFGVTGIRTVYELRGTCMYPFESKSTPKKSIISSRSFGKKIYSKEDLWESIASHVDHIARELRQAHQAAQCITVGIYTSRFGEFKYGSKTDSYFFDRPTNNTNELLDIARTSLDSIYEPDIPYIKSGIHVSSLYSDEFIYSPSLFENFQILKSKNLDSIVDTLDQKYGEGVIKLGTLFTPRQKGLWLPKSQMRSPEFTTSWNNLLIIRKNFY